MRLWLYLKSIRPTIIICLGSVAAKLYWYKPKAQHRNKLYQIGDNLYLGYVYHPAGLARRMQKGDMVEYKACIDFMNEVKIKAEGMTKSKNFTLQCNGRYPFEFINSCKLFV